MEELTLKKQYSVCEKTRTLRLLEKNNFNYLQTAKQSGITRKTIKNWEGKYGTEVFNVKSPTETALIEIDVEMKQNDINILRKLYTLRRQVLDRVISIADKEVKLESLVNILKFISGELEKFNEIEKKTPTSSDNFIALIMSNMKASQEEQSNFEHFDK